MPPEAYIAIAALIVTLGAWDAFRRYLASRNQQASVDWEERLTAAEAATMAAQAAVVKLTAATSNRKAFEALTGGKDGETRKPRQRIGR